MPRITLLIGVLLAFLGMAFFLYTGATAYTALIPAGFGVVLILLGLLGSVEHLRKHTMHAAAAIALIGFVFGVVRLIPGPTEGRGIAYAETAIFAALSGLLLLLCVKSFIDARRRRQKVGEPGA